MISLPERFLSEIDKAAQAEHRTRSDLIREALREYFREPNRSKKPIESQRVREAFETLRSVTGSSPNTGDSVICFEPQNNWCEG